MTSNPKPHAQQNMNQGQIQELNQEIDPLGRLEFSVCILTKKKKKKKKTFPAGGVHLSPTATSAHVWCTMSGKRTLGHRIRPWAQFSFSSRVRLERCDSVFLFDVWYLFHTTVPKQIHHPLSSLRAYILTKIARTFPSDTIQSRTVCSPFLVLCVRPIPQMSNW